MSLARYAVSSEIWWHAVVKGISELEHVNETGFLLATLHGNINQVDCMPRGPTNFAAITTHPLRFCGGKISITISRKQHCGLSWLHIKDDDDPQSVKPVEAWCFSFDLHSLTAVKQQHWRLIQPSWQHSWYWPSQSCSSPAYISALQKTCQASHGIVCIWRAAVLVAVMYLQRHRHFRPRQQHQQTALVEVSCCHHLDHTRGHHFRYDDRHSTGWGKTLARKYSSVHIRVQLKVLFGVLPSYCCISAHHSVTAPLVDNGTELPHERF